MNNTANASTLLAPTATTDAARAAWLTARSTGASPEQAAAAAWTAIRASNRTLRAPSGLVACDSNKGGGRKSYRSPLAQAVLADPSRFEDFGSHSGSYPMTKKASAECADRRAELLDLLVSTWG